jgi:hypothetical protein
MPSVIRQLCNELTKTKKLEVCIYQLLPGAGYQGYWERGVIIE